MIREKEKTKDELVEKEKQTLSHLASSSSEISATLEKAKRDLGELENERSIVSTSIVQLKNEAFDIQKTKHFLESEIQGLEALKIQKLEIETSIKNLEDTSKSKELELKEEHNKLKIGFLLEFEEYKKKCHEHLQEELASMREATLLSKKEAEKMLRILQEKESVLNTRIARLNELTRDSTDVIP